MVVSIAFLAVSYHSSAEKLIIPIPDDSTKVAYELNLDEIEVDAQRVPVTYSQVARIVTVLERDQIEAAPVESIQELLEYVPGIDVFESGAGKESRQISEYGEDRLINCSSFSTESTSPTHKQATTI